MAPCAREEDRFGDIVCILRARVGRYWGHFHERNRIVWFLKQWEAGLCPEYCADDVKAIKAALKDVEREMKDAALLVAATAVELEFIQGHFDDPTVSETVRMSVEFTLGQCNHHTTRGGT